MPSSIWKSSYNTAVMGAMSRYGGMVGNDQGAGYRILNVMSITIMTSEKLEIQ
jgi:hypothetical protein